MGYLVYFITVRFGRSLPEGKFVAVLNVPKDKNTDIKIPCKVKIDFSSLFTSFCELCSTKETEYKEKLEEERYIQEGLRDDYKRAQDDADYWRAQYHDLKDRSFKGEREDGEGEEREDEERVAEEEMWD